jgi:hypothetical protein
VSHGNQKRGRRRKAASATRGLNAYQQADTFMDRLHRDDSSRARNWANAPAPGSYRRPKPPPVPRTEQRDGSRLVEASRSQIEKVLSADGPLYFITDRDGNVKMLKIERSER